jgi:hypothetical protein
MVTPAISFVELDDSVDPPPHPKSCIPTSNASAIAGNLCADILPSSWHQKLSGRKGQRGSTQQEVREAKECLEMTPRKQLQTINTLYYNYVQGINMLITLNPVPAALLQKEGFGRPCIRQKKIFILTLFSIIPL